LSVKEESKEAAVSGDEQGGKIVKRRGKASAETREEKSMAGAQASRRLPPLL